MDISEYNSVFYKMVKSVFNVAEFTKLMLYNCIKVVTLKPDQLCNLTSGYIYGPIYIYIYIYIYNYMNI